MKRIILIVAIILFCLYGMTHPVSKELNVYLSEHEGENISLGFVKVLEANDNSTYTVQTGFEKENTTVMSDGKFQAGDIVSFYGTVRNGVLHASKHHLHHNFMYPYNAVYFLSLAGFILLILLFLKDWKMDLRRMRFKKRKE